MSDPWFRCQALAAVALAASDKALRQRALEEAFAAADELPDVARRATAASFPLKVLCRTSGGKPLATELKRLLSLAGSEPSPVRRADALNYVLGAVVTAPVPLFCEALDHLVAACVEPLAGGRANAKGQSHLATWAVIAHAIDPALSSEIVARITGPTLRARVDEQIRPAGSRSASELCSWPNIAG